MGPLKTLIVDDERLARLAIREAIAHRDDILITAECVSAAEAAAALQSAPVDLLFLDIQMPQQSGFDLLAALHTNSCPKAVVFVTAYHQYAVRAFECHAVDYLLKPIAPDRVALAIERTKQRLLSQDRLALTALQTLVNDLRRPQEFPQRLAVKDGRRTLFLPVTEIDTLEAEENYVRIHTAQQNYLIRATLKGLEEALDPRLFCRTNRSTLARLAAIRELRSEDGEDYVKLANARLLRLSPLYRARLENRLRTWPNSCYGKVEMSPSSKVEMSS